MKTLKAGHKYELANFEDPNAPGQILQFIEKEPVPAIGPDDEGKLITINDGTTNEEVLAMLIDRMGSLQARFPCRENSIATTHLETALLWLNFRTANRKNRGVEGKHLA